MPIVVSIVVALAALLCFVRPVVGFAVYLAVIVIRPNELLEGMILPAGPLMIVAAGLGFLVTSRFALPRIDGARPKAPLLAIAMVGLLLIHMLILHPEGLINWILIDVAQWMLMLLYMTKHFSTPERLPLQLNNIMASSSVIALVPLPIHFLFKGAPKLLGPDGRPLYVPSYGKVWDDFHMNAERLMGKLGTMWANPNALGMAANWAIPGALYNLRKKGSKLAKLFYLALLGALLTTLILTGSRAGQLQLGIILWMVFVGGRRKALGIVLLVVMMVGIVVVLPRLEPQRADAGASSRERGWLLGAGVQMFKSSPLFGIGYMNYQQNAPKRLMAHNVYMQSLAETGLIGFGLFVTLIYFLRRETSAAVRHLENGPDPNIALAARCIGAMQFGFTIYAFFANVFMSFQFAIPMTTAMALHLAMLRARSEQEKAEAAAVPAAPVEVEQRVAVGDPAPRQRRLAAGEPPRRFALPAHQPEDPGGGSRWVFDPTAPEAGLQRLDEDEGGPEDDDEPPSRSRPRR